MRRWREWEDLGGGRTRKRKRESVGEGRKGPKECRNVTYSRILVTTSINTIYILIRVCTCTLDKKVILCYVLTVVVSIAEASLLGGNFSPFKRMR